MFEGREGEWEGEISVGCLSCTPIWGPGLQPRCVPWLGIKLATFWFVGWRPTHWTTPFRAGDMFWKSSQDFINIYKEFYDTFMISFFQTFKPLIYMQCILMLVHGRDVTLCFVIPKWLTQSWYFIQPGKGINLHPLERIDIKWTFSHLINCPHLYEATIILRFQFSNTMNWQYISCLYWIDCLNYFFCFRCFYWNSISHS